MKNIAVDHLKWLRCLIDYLEPGNRSRAIAFIAAFPDLWGPLDAPTKTPIGLKSSVCQSTRSALPRTVSASQHP
jgi:hypothetical protein